MSLSINLKTTDGIDGKFGRLYFHLFIAMFLKLAKIANFGRKIVMECEAFA
jgi:hypothetical protein